MNKYVTMLLAILFAGTMSGVAQATWPTSSENTQTDKEDKSDTDDADSVQD